MPDLATVIGLAAAFCTTLSYVPQVKMSWSTGETGDLSLTMLCVLALGLGAWVMYGVLHGDTVIIIANSVSLSLLGVVLAIKLRNAWGGIEDAE